MSALSLRRSPALLVVACVLVCSRAAALPADELLRIRILTRHQPETVELSGEEGLLLFAGAKVEPLHRLAPGEIAALSVRGSEVFVEMGDLRLNALSLRAVPTAGGALTVRVARGASPGLSRRYGGSLSVSAEGGQLQLVNHIDVETYVASVVGSEYGFDDLEGAKAMAVIIRTYALRALGKFGEAYDHVDHTLSQVYTGLDAITPTAREAARLTAGEILTYDGHPVEAVYFAASGGHTADNDAVWNTPPRPYLRGRPDPYDRSPHATWQFVAPRKALLDALSEAFGFRVEGFLIEARSRDGRVQTITLLGNPERSVSGNDFRLAVLRRFGATSLKSTLFDARVRGNEYVFDGRGFGHGVGLSQWGAHEMARQGHTYRDILAFYYTNVTLQKGADYAALLKREVTPAVTGRTTTAPIEPPPVRSGAGPAEARNARRAAAEAAPPPPTVTPGAGVPSWTGVFRPATSASPARDDARRPGRRIGW